MINKIKKAKFLRWLPGLVVSIIVIFFIARIVNFDDLKNSISTIGGWNILIIAGITIISICARAVAWMKLLPKVKFLDSFLLINESYLFNNLIPRSGEVVKTILFAKPASESAFKVVSSVIIERSFDLVIAASLFLVTFPFITQLSSIRPIAILLLIGFVAFLGIVVLVSLKAEKVKQLLRQFGEKHPGLIEKAIPKIEMVIDGFQVLTNWRQILSVFFWIAMSWILWTFLLYFGLKVVVGNAKFWWAIFAEGVLALGIALPSAPAGLGVYEGTMAVALSAFDIPIETSFGLAIVIHIVQIILTSLIGFIAVIRQGESISTIFKKISTSQKKDQTGEQE